MATTTLDWREELKKIAPDEDGQEAPPFFRRTLAECRMLRDWGKGGVNGETIDDLVQQCCKIANLVVMDDSASPQEKAVVNRTLQLVYYLTQAANYAVASHRCLDSGPGTEDEEASDEQLLSSVARFSPQNAEDTNRIQKLIMYMLNCLYASGYRRHNGACYRARYIGGVCTHSWDRVCDIQEFIYDNTQKEINFDMWCNLTCTRANLVTVVEHLSNCKDVQFPPLVRDRHVFSFSNGIYFAAEDRFSAFDQVDMSGGGGGGGGRLAAAAKFFDLTFEDTDSKREDWYSGIQTPHLQSILDYQRLDPEVCKWMYVFIGRLIYEVGELDEWQVVPYLKGAASTGKSTILMRVCRSLYETADVGVLSNNIEKKFGLASLADKFVFIGPEIKSDISLEQAEFQSLVSGETLQVAVKFMPSKTIQWRVPGILAGNEVPGWVDNSGSINRRIIMFEFERPVTNGDMTLGQKLEEEMAHIILKANRAYLEAVHLYAKDNIWLHLPPAFHRAKEELNESANSMVGFLNSGRLEFNEELYMPFVDFMESYKDYCRQTGGRQINQGDFKNHLRAMSCEVIRKTTLKYPPDGKNYMANSKFVMGVDIARPSSSQNME